MTEKDKDICFIYGMFIGSVAVLFITILLYELIR